MSRLTPGEKKTILQLHNDGKSIKEIIAITKRSREAVINLFVDCGIGEGSVQLQSRIWQKAEREYWKECRCSYKSGSPKFDELPMDVQNKWYEIAYKEYMAESQTYINTIMGYNEPKIGIDISKKEDDMVIHLDKNSWDKLMKIGEGCKINDMNLLASFLITKEYLSAQKYGLIPIEERKEEKNE